MLKKGKFVSVRPDSIIEARYDLTPKQNDILDIVLSKIEDYDDKYCYEILVDDYKTIYKKIQAIFIEILKKLLKNLKVKDFI
ncbi:hypothetical protein G8V03_14350 [Clostridium botulinum D/C]|nr:RepB family plasmid replication initiator protein [Clostridium botulinum]MCD3352140.1 hypothetical protein [Clostridium botulinum D/C]MCD3361087.1 hypothetical protein [Clostridium botulinum D/C]MCD3363680.1 hypothetical protein [Clostridium botulinum D/C]MCD3366845.1 hypothetical protein [Clostridium botulinum D/C]